MDKKKAPARQGKERGKGRHGPTPKAKRLKQSKDELFGFMAGQFVIVGDIESPILDWAHWRPAKNL
jgi:hypothetical protein